MRRGFKMIKEECMRNNKLLYILSVLAFLFYSSILFAAVPVEVSVGKETVLKLNKPIKSIKRVSLANEDIAEIKPLIAPTPDEVDIIIYGKKLGTTSLIVWDTEGKKIFFDVHAIPNISEIKEHIKNMPLTDEITVTYANDYIVLSGTALNEETIKKVHALASTYAKEGTPVETTRYSAGMTETIKTPAVRVLNLIQVKEAQQVMLEVRVAQIDKSKLKDLGVGVLIKGTDAEGTFPGLIGSPAGILGEGTTFGKTNISNGSAGYNANNTTNSSNTYDNILGQLTKDTITNGNTTGYTTANTLTDTISKNRGSSIKGFDLEKLTPQIGVSYFPGGVSVILKALASKGFAKVLAEPNMVVRSGEKGAFLAGKEVPVQIVTGIPPTPSIEYRKVGIMLNFAPEVMETGVIRLKIDPAEVSSVARYITFYGGLVAPEIDTRSVKTSVDLKEGESLILAGLLSEEMIKNMQKIPILGDIPILGALFRSTHDELSQKELAFFITPKLVKPIPAGEETERKKSELLGVNRPTPEEERELQWIPLPGGKSEPEGKTQ